MSDVSTYSAYAERTGGMSVKKKRQYGFLLMFAMCIMLGYLYRLRLPFAIVLGVAQLILLPVWLRQKKEQQRQQKRFMDANLYMEQVLYSFRKSRKVLAALEDMVRLFPDGTMHDCIRAAIEKIRGTYEGEHVPEEALAIIGQTYPSRRIALAHSLMVKTERLGGSCEDSVRILLRDRSIWEQEVEAVQRNCRMQKRNVMIAIVLSCLLCLLTPFMCAGTLSEIRITDHILYQTGSTMMLVSGMVLCVCAEKYFARDWIKDQTGVQGGEKLYWKVKNYNFHTSFCKNIIPAGIAGLAAVLSVAAGHWLLASCLFPVLLFFLFLHRIDYSLAKKRLVREIRQVFPDWLMEVSLLLQTENVMMSITKSMDHAADILKPELEKMMTQLLQMPESNLPYKGFMEELQIPEVASAMGMLYSVSDGSGADSSVQIGEILERNAQWVSQTETGRNKDRASVLYLMFLLPALFAALKMVVDMSLILFAFFAKVR